MLAPGNQRFTVYDAMDAKGVFAANSANASAGPNYARQEFPMMLYHPQGAERVTDPGEIIATLMGPKVVGEKRELISIVVDSPERLAEALADGWHKHPAKANAAAGRASAPMSSEDRIKELEAQIAAQSAELAEAKSLAGID